MFRYGERVVIRDGSKLDCSLEIVYRVKDGQVMVLIDREVNWPAAETHLESQDQTSKLFELLESNALLIRNYSADQRKKFLTRFF